MNDQQSEEITARQVSSDGWELEGDGFGEYELRCPSCENLTGETIHEIDLPHVFACPFCGRESVARELWDYSADVVIAYLLMSPADQRYLQWLADQGRPADWRDAQCL